MKLNIQCVALGPTRSISVIGLSWFGGAAAAGTPISGRPALVVCYETGKLQIMRNENDDCMCPQPSPSLNTEQLILIQISLFIFSANNRRHLNASGGLSVES